MNASKLIAALAISTWATATFSQNINVVPPQNVLQLSASAQIEVTQDLLQLSMSTTREGQDANAVQAQLKTALDAALTEAKKTAQEGQMDVRTGNFSLYPRYGKDGKAGGWTGSAEMVLDGRDFARITAAAGKISTLVVSNVQFGLTREQRAKVETQAQSVAIERFKTKAGELAKGFGFASYTLREVAVNSNDGGGLRQRNMVMESRMSSASSEALPVEAGKTAVQVTVSGSVQLK